jgi:hypothetical protein
MGVRQPDSIHILIDRLLFTGFDATPFQAEQIRVLLESELRRQLEREEVAGWMVATDIPNLEAPSVAVSGAGIDRSVAGGLARSVARSLQGVEQ